MSVFSDLIAEKMVRYQHLNLQEGNHTIGALTSAILSIDDPAQATAFHEGYLEWQRALLLAAHPSDGGRFEAPEEIVRFNIGWCFGEGMDPQRVEMWVAVCDARHPVFGVTKPTADEAFEAGIRMGEAMLHGES